MSVEPTADNPITDADRRLAKLLNLPPETIWAARQPLPISGDMATLIYAIRMAEQ